MSDEVERKLRRVANHVRAIGNEIADQSGVDGSPELRDRYNALVGKAEEAASDDFSEYVADESYTRAFGELLGIGVHSLPEKRLDIRRFRPLVNSFILELEEYSPAPASSEPQDADRSQVVVNMVNGDSVAISTAGRDSRQTVSFDVSPGDVQALTRALEGVRVPRDSIDTLVKDVRADSDDYEGRRRSAWGWFAQFSSDAASGAVAGVVVDAMPAVAAAISAFVGQPIAGTS